jgi:ferric-dicitrate binding protein FerR (iron transport regulator)
MTLSAEQRDDLISRHLDGLLSEDEAHQLKGIAERDPEVAKVLAQALCVHAALMRQFDPDARFEDQTDAVMGKIEATGLPLRPATSRPAHAVFSRKWQRSLALAAAAALLAMAGVWWWGGREGRVSTVKGEVVARVVKKVSGVRCQVSGRAWTELAVGNDVRAGTRIETGKDGTVTLAWVKEPTTVELEGHSTLDTRHSTLAFLTRGRLTATVAKQAPGKPFVVETPQARLTVLGTRLALEATPDAARLEVLDGRVRFQRLDLPVSLDVSSGGYAMAGPGITLAANARYSSPNESLRVIEDHEGPIAWKQSPDSARLAFELSPVAHNGRNSLRGAYEPKADDRRKYGTIVHPFTLKPGDHALRFFISVERYEGNADWNIQVRQRDGTCWFLGGGMFWDLGKGWNLVELEFPRAPVNAYGGGTYQPAEVQELLFSVCQRSAAFTVDEFSVVGGERP